jgi:bifunctional DNA-binding transcriptional regulator/antitoxin component of YhaV-PrlF toxin-antitoxin module
MRVIRFSIPTIFCAALLLTACGSGGIDDILRGGGAALSDVRGTIDRVDTRDRVIVVNVDDAYRSNLRNANDQVAVYYDDRTVVEYNGRRYDPEDLERGDRVTIRVDQSGSRLLAERIDVTYDAGSGSAVGTSADLRGIVRYVDTGARTIELERTVYGRNFDPGSRRGDVVTVNYDSQTVVRFQGRDYRPENLERGDEVEVDVRDVGNRLLAEQIVVVNDVRGGL